MIAIAQIGIRGATVAGTAIVGVIGTRFCWLWRGNVKKGMTHSDAIPAAARQTADEVKTAAGIVTATDTIKRRLGG
jgi:hypothetical protein